MLLNVAFSELKMKKGKVVLTNRGSIVLKEINFALKKNIELQNTGAKIQTLGNEANLKINEELATSSGADR